MQLIIELSFYVTKLLKIFNEYLLNLGVVLFNFHCKKRRGVRGVQG